MSFEDWKMPLSIDEVRKMRDKKLRDTMQDAAPIWLVHEEPQMKKESLIFHVVYVSPIDGWVNHRYKYDAAVDVLYQLGVKKLREEETLAIQETEPHIAAPVVNYVRNAPSERLSPQLPTKS
jgi:hypothetical protein